MFRHAFHVEIKRFGFLPSLNQKFSWIGDFPKTCGHSTICGVFGNPVRGMAPFLTFSANSSMIGSKTSHTCQELSKQLVGKKVTVHGWINKRGVDRVELLGVGQGSIQLVSKAENVAVSNAFQNVKQGSVVAVEGVLCTCTHSGTKPKEQNGELEILVQSIVLIKSSDIVPLSNKVNTGGSGDDSSRKMNTLPVTESSATTEKLEPTKPDPNMYCGRTHTCGELGISNVGEKVRLMGWIEFFRMNKFISLRDRYGRTQLIITDVSGKLESLVNELTLESVIEAEGVVCLRPPGQRSDTATGSIEVSLTDLKVLNKAKECLPLYVRDFNQTSESVRMKYRYLDLRGEYMQNNLRLRSTVIHKMRRFLIEHMNFLEVETPTLFRRTPGGAQEFIVPTEEEGKFYSLVQSPQQFKQLLMVGSVDRYFQLARCYRDETVQSDRQPEFTQLDLEMSFCDREDVLNLIEDLLKHCWPESLPPLAIPFRRLSYEESMNSYGTDKPDLRFDWKLENFTELFKHQKDNCEGKVDVKMFAEKENFAAHAFVARKANSGFSNTAKKNITEEMKSRYPSVNLYVIPIKYFEISRELLETLFCRTIAEEIKNTVNYMEGDILFLALGPYEEVLEALGEIRMNVANYLEDKSLEIIKKNAFDFVWILDFPLFIKKGDKISACHHPFTQPRPEDRHLLESEPLKVKSLHYDLVLNGKEIGGGSIRIHEPRVQELILNKILNINSEPLSHLLGALSSGAPPHGGIALGIDRLMAILCGAQTMRDVIAFPKGHRGQDLMAGAPCDISEAEKKRYHVKSNNVKLVEKKE